MKMEETPLKDAKILEVVSQTPGVYYPHQLRTRRIGNTIAIEITIRVDPTLSIVQAHDIATQVENRLRDEFGKDIFVSTHIEPYFKSQHLK
jgi:divalent metal cation (Fe/Co/Zn/Cd) transporter